MVDPALFADIIIAHVKVVLCRQKWEVTFSGYQDTFRQISSALPDA